jgi:hypothetical protein
MKKTIIIFYLFVIAISNNRIYPQSNTSDSSMKFVNKHFIHIVKKSIKTYYQFYKKCDLNFDNIYAINVENMSIKERKYTIGIFRIQTIVDYDDNLNRSVGYLIIDKKIILIYSDSCKKELIDIIKVPPVNKEILKEIETKYPRYTDIRDQLKYMYFSREPSWLRINFNKHRNKIIDYALDPS